MNSDAVVKQFVLAHLLRVLRGMLGGAALTQIQVRWDHISILAAQEHERLPAIGRTGGQCPGGPVPGWGTLPLTPILQRAGRTVGVFW